MSKALSNIVQKRVNIEPKGGTKLPATNTTTTNQEGGGKPIPIETGGYSYRWQPSNNTSVTNTKSLNKQSRGYLKTAAKSVAKDTINMSFFKVPHFDNEVNPYKEVLSKKTAITGNLLIALWQARKDGKGVLKITNLSEIARLLDVTVQELKLYLVYLGGYQRPITKLEIVKEPGKKEKRILSTYSDKIFYIKFKFILQDGEKEEDFNNDFRIGTNYLSFIRDRDIESVEVIPALSIQEELKGGGLGNVLVGDSFIAFCLDLTDLAYKLFCLSSSNKPSFSITFEKLVGAKYLNLEKQIKGTYNEAGKRIITGTGKAKMLKKIKDALDELKIKGHLQEWDYNEQTEIFNWIYTDKYIKHKELIKKKVENLQDIS